MEETHQELSFLPSHLQTSFACILFFLTISLFLFHAILFLLRQKHVYCKCEICASYISLRWSREFKNLCDWYTHLLHKSPSQTIHVHLLGNTITANPDNVEHILKTRFNNYPKGKSFSAILGDLLGNGIFNVDGHMWLFQRKMVSLELSSISIRTYAFEIVAAETIGRLLPLLSSAATAAVRDTSNNGGGIDLQDVFRRFSFDNICKFSFGLDPCCLEASMPISLFAESFDLATKLSAERAAAPLPLLWKIKRLFNIGKERRLKEAIKVVNVLANEVIIQKRKLGFSAHKDLLSRFMASIKSDDKYLRDIVISFILAGRDTMASALTTFIWLLANHPQVVSKIIEESSQIMASDQELASYEQIREMHYLHAAVYESLRLYPPVQFDSKFAREDDILPDGTFVKKDTRVTYHPYAMGRMESIWATDCKEFKPERWINKNDGEFLPQSPYRYPVFQAGARTCLGKELSIEEMKMVAVSVVRKFDIRVVSPVDAPQFEPGLTAMFRGGLQAEIRKRNNFEVAPQ